MLLVKLRESGCVITIYFTYFNLATYLYLQLGLIAETKPKGEVPEFTQPLKKVETTEKKTARLECKFKGKPTPTIEWFKDDDKNKLKPSKRVKMTVEKDTAILEFKETELDDEGIFKCVAKNDSGTANTEAELLVDEAGEKPSFKSPHKDVNVTESDEARFDVRVAGQPEPVVEWFKNDTKITDEGRTVLLDDEEEDLFSLVIEHVKPEDAGVYKCVASNDVGETSCTANLQVQEKMIAPEFVGGDEAGPITIVEDDELHLEVKVEGQPKPEITWNKDGKPLKETKTVTIEEKDDSYRIDIKGVSLDDSGKYKCEAKSEAGTVSRTYEVVVEGSSNTSSFY